MLVKNLLEFGLKLRILVPIIQEKCFQPQKNFPPKNQVKLIN